jgi:uroporphyrinogen decarboxylase
MTDKQWENILEVLSGKIFKPLPIGFIIDSPWIPKWYGINMIDYFSNDELWLKSNIAACDNFPEIIFLPGFWSEFGMCSEPSAFGSKSSFPKNEFPNAYQCIYSIENIKKVQKPNPETDGFCPFILNRLLINRKEIEKHGHKIKFSVSRGPLNIASYLMGTTEFLTAMMMNPDEIHYLISLITDFLVEWHELQRKTFDTIEGIFILDDIIGFMGEEEFKSFGLPYFKKLFNCNVKVRFLHNDADCSVSAKYLPEMGVNLFNMAFNTSLNELKTVTNNSVTMLGNIPPRDVLANGSFDDIKLEINKLISSLTDKSHIIVSCGGGMPPYVTSEKLKFFVDEVKKITS